MNLSDFNFELPNELIARYPLEQRSASRLLCVDNQNYTHRQFSELLDLLSPNDLLIFNNTKVIPARLFGQKDTGGKVEILIEKIINDHEVRALIRASKSPKMGSEIIVDPNIKIKVIERDADAYHLVFDDERNILDILNAVGHIPLPPYMERLDTAADRERYQTVYAEAAGAIAAPTAGLHFDQALLAKIAELGVATAFVTLHVGIGTFQPVRVEKITEHHMHAEYAEVSREVCEKIQATQARHGRVIAVGTTTVRCLETAALSGKIQPFCGETDIFIYPGFQFKCVDAMITNFHLPHSTLLMLVSAFAGYAAIMEAYKIAVEKKYRFFSYGDAMWLTRNMFDAI